jgi:hypothetical protein
MGAAPAAATAKFCRSQRNNFLPVSVTVFNVIVVSV